MRGYDMTFKCVVAYLFYQSWQKHGVYWLVGIPILLFVSYSVTSKVTITISVNK